MTIAAAEPKSETSPDVRSILDKVRAEGRNALTAPEARTLCEIYGIQVPREGLAASADDAVRLAEGLGFPVVLKIVSPQILHTPEAGGALVGRRRHEEDSAGTGRGGRRGK